MSLKSKEIKMKTTELLALATEAGNKAGDLWLSKATTKFIVRDGFTGKSCGTLLDLCGNAWVRITDKRTKFAKEAKKLGYAPTSSGSIFFPYKHRRQEMGLNEAMTEASFKVLKENGVNGITVYSYID
jgi:hypothetical protein